MLRALVVDAVPSSRSALVHALVESRMFEEVAEADSLDQAVAQAGEIQPEVVFVDVDLPRLLGSDLISALQGAHGGVQVVVTSHVHAIDGAASGDPRALSQLLGSLVEDARSAAILQATIYLPNDPRSVARSRRFVDLWCRAWGVDDVLESVTLVVSELVTNAIAHGGGIRELRLGLLDGVVRVEVADRGMGVPQIPPSSILDDGGRGLRIVSKSARAWGIDDTGAERKVIWAEIAALSARAPTDQGMQSRS
jgi:CheY-like chemotaxis protein